MRNIFATIRVNLELVRAQADKVGVPCPGVQEIHNASDRGAALLEMLCARIKADGAHVCLPDEVQVELHERVHRGSTRQTGKLLYIDDDEALLSLVKRVLARRGIEVSAHKRAAAGLAAFRAEPESFSMILTDYQMPGMSGVEVAIAASDIRPGIRVVLVSGNLSEESRRRASEVGIFKVLSKPYAVEDLCDLLSTT